MIAWDAAIHFVHKGEKQDDCLFLIKFVLHSKSWK